MPERLVDRTPLAYTRIARFASAWRAAVRDGAAQIPALSGEVSGFSLRNVQITRVRILVGIGRDALAIAAASAAIAGSERQVRDVRRRQSAVGERARKERERAANAPGQDQEAASWRLKVAIWIGAPAIDYAVLVTALQEYIDTVIELNVLCLGIGVILALAFYAIGRLLLSKIVLGWPERDAQWYASCGLFVTLVFCAVQLLLAVGDARTEGLEGTSDAGALGDLFVYLQGLAFLMTLSIGYVDALTHVRIHASKTAAKAERRADGLGERGDDAAIRLDRAHAKLATATRRARLRVERERAEGRVIDYRYVERVAAERRQQHGELVVPGVADEPEIPDELLDFHFPEPAAPDEPTHLYPTDQDEEPPADEEAV